MDKGFRWRRALPGRALSDIEPLDWELNAALKQLVGATWKRRLVQIRDGKRIARGPWRKSHDAVQAFGQTIRTKGKVGDVFRVWGPAHKIGRVQIENYFPGLKALERGFTQLGAPYVFGSSNGPEDEGPDRFDCSGLFIWTWQPWVELPHGAELIRQWGIANHRMIAAAALREGDAVLFNFPNDRGLSWPRASHIGLFNGHGTVLDTRSPASPVAVREIDWSRVVGLVRPRS